MEYNALESSLSSSIIALYVGPIQSKVLVTSLGFHDLDTCSIFCFRRSNSSFCFSLFFIRCRTLPASLAAPLYSVIMLNCAENYEKKQQFSLFRCCFATATISPYAVIAIDQLRAANRAANLEFY